MRRIYTVDTKRKRIVQEALLQMRATQAALGPEFMARIKVLVRDFDPESLIPGPAPVASPPSPAMPEALAAPISDDREPVDQKKNLQIVMKFLQLKQDNRNVQNQIRALLADLKTLP